MQRITLLISLSGILWAGCTHPAPPHHTLQLRAQGIFDPPTVRSFPSDAPTINRWIAGYDTKAIRAHGWDIWEAINSPTANGEPIWQKWHSGYEIFEATDGIDERNHGLDFEIPTQFFHAGNPINTGKTPVKRSERPTSFNRFSYNLAHFIWDNQLYLQSTLNKANRQFDSLRTPIAAREISTSKDSVDAFSFALKPVFQFISGNQPTAIPYWAGVTVYSSANLTNPEPATWRQCVIVDPTGKLQPGTMVAMPCNAETGKKWPVIALDRFYSIQIDSAQAASFSQFAETSGDDVGKNDKTDADSIKAMVQPGNIALLTAMHVTGKEIINWTWQSFWWSPNPNDPVFGNDRPATLPAPWSNYNMTTAYYMVAPSSAPNSGEPLISYNPYLETNLSGTLTAAVGSKTPIQWYGVFSNCMSCHRGAAWDHSTYVPNGFVDIRDSILFHNKTKTDFLWSIPTRAR